MGESRATTTRKSAIKKTYYASNLKSSLTALVILHHAATSYGGEGRSPYQSSYHGQGSSAALVGFNAINQSFFMGTFMYLSGHFSRLSLERKGTAAFLKDRLYRLGLPTAGYTLIGAPFCVAVDRKFKREPTGLQVFVDYWKQMKGVRGPLWFTATLLTFDFVLAGLRWASGKLDVHLETQRTQARNRHVPTFALLTGIATTSLSDFLVRTVYPVGTIFNPLKLNVGYVSQYVACYVFGVYAPHIEHAVPANSVLTALAILSAGTTTLFAKAVAATSKPFPPQLKGGYNMLAGYYALWGNLTGYLLGSSLLAIYAKHFNNNWKWINDYAFSAFVVHIPVMTVLGCATDTWRASGIVKTAVVGGATVFTSWIAGFIGSEVWSWTERAWQPSDKKQG